jgi:hypothetical protein
MMPGLCCRSFLVAAAVCISLGACQAPVNSGAKQSGKQHQDDAEIVAGAKLGTCSDGLTATLRGQLEVEYLGSHSADPDLCVVQWDGKPHYYYLGFWNLDRPDKLTQREQEALRRVLDGPPGTQVEIDAGSGRLWRAASVTHMADPVVTLNNERRATAEIWVVRHDALRRPGVMAETRYWIDRATGIVLRSAVVAHMADGTEQATTTWEVETLQRAG